MNEIQERSAFELLKKKGSNFSQKEQRVFEILSKEYGSQQEDLPIPPQTPIKRRSLFTGKDSYSEKVVEKPLNWLSKLPNKVIEPVIGAAGDVYSALTPDIIEAPERKIAGSIFGGLNKAGSFIGKKLAENSPEALRNAAIGLDESERLKRNLETGFNIGTLLPFGPGAKAGKVANKIFSKKAILPEVAAANKAAEGVGYTLSKGMEQAPLGKAVGGGMWGELETGLLQNMPFSRKLFGAMKEKNYSVAKKEVEKIQSSVANISDDALKNKLQGEVDRANEIIGNLYKQTTEASKEMYVPTKGLSESIKKGTGLFDNEGQLKTTYSGIPSGELNKITSIAESAENLEIKKISGGAGENFSSFTTLRKDVGGELGRIRAIKENAMNQVSSGINSSTAGRLEGIYSKMYKTLSDVEESHIANIEKVTKQPGLLNTYKEARELFREDRPIQNVINKIVGTGEGATDKGFKSANKSMGALLNPKEVERFNTVWEYVDDSTKEAIRGKMLNNIIQPAKTMRMIDGVENTIDLSVNRLGKEWGKARKAYGNDMLQKIFGKETVDKMDNFVLGSERARIDKVSLYNEGNPSSTGSAAVFASIITSAVTGNVGSAAAIATGHIGTGALGLALTPAILYGTRVASKVATKTPLNAFEKGMSGSFFRGVPRTGAVNVGYELQNQLSPEDRIKLMQDLNNRQQGYQQ